MGFKELLEIALESLAKAAPEVVLLVISLLAICVLNKYFVKKLESTYTKTLAVIQKDSSILEKSQRKIIDPLEKSVRDLTNKVCKP